MNNAFLFFCSKFRGQEIRIKFNFIHFLQVKDLRIFAYIWITLQDFPTILLFEYLPVIKKSAKGKNNCFSSLVHGKNLQNRDLRIISILRDCEKKNVDTTTIIEGKNMRIFFFYSTHEYIKWNGYFTNIGIISENRHDSTKLATILRVNRLKCKY